MRQLIDVGCNVDAVTAMQQTPLHLAVEAGLYRCTKLLLECGASTTATDGKGLSAQRMAERRILDEILPLLSAKKSKK